MRMRHNVIIAAVLLNLLALSLSAQTTQIVLQPAQTKQELTKALRDFREKQDRQGEALTLLQLGMAVAATGDVAGARSNLTEAVEKMRAQNDFVGTWMALMTLGQLELLVGRSSEAASYLDSALTVLLDAKTSTAPFRIKTVLAVGSASGLSAEMFKTLDESQAGMLKGLAIQFSFEPMTHDLYGSALTQVGKLEKAEAELKAAAAGTIYAQGMYDFSIQSHFGDLRFRQARYDEARAHYIKAVESKTALPAPADRQVKAGIYDRLVRLEEITHHPEEAKRWSQKAAELGRKQTGSR
jgi:tetratricopeptide (TPR) repeat protein